MAQKQYNFKDITTVPTAKVRPAGGRGRWGGREGRGGRGGRAGPASWRRRAAHVDRRPLLSAWSNRAGRGQA